MNVAEIVISKKTNYPIIPIYAYKVPKQSREMVQTLMIGLNCQKLHVKSFVHVCVCVCVCACVCGVCVGVFECVCVCMWSHLTMEGLGTCTCDY